MVEGCGRDGPPPVSHHNDRMVKNHIIVYKKTVIILPLAEEIFAYGYSLCQNNCMWDDEPSWSKHWFLSLQHVVEMFGFIMRDLVIWHGHVAMETVF